MQHPDCYVPVLADPYFFDRYYHLGLEWYSGLFRGAPASARAIGELSHDYLFSPAAAERIARDLPGVRLLVCLRHPVERAFSQYLSMVRAGMTRIPFEAAIRTFPEIIGHSRYATHLATYYSHFSRDQINVLWYENLVYDPVQFGKQIFDFLGVSTPINIAYGRHVNPAGYPRSFWAARLARALTNFARDLGFTTLVGRLKRSRVRELFYREFAPNERPVIHPATRQQLLAALEPDVEELENLLGVTLRHWRQ